MQCLSAPSHSLAEPAIGQIRGSARDDLIASSTEMWVLPQFVKTFGTNGIRGHRTKSRPMAPQTVGLSRIRYLIVEVADPSSAEVARRPASLTPLRRAQRRPPPAESPRTR